MMFYKIVGYLYTNERLVSEIKNTGIGIRTFSNDRNLYFAKNLYF